VPIEPIRPPEPILSPIMMPEMPAVQSIVAQYAASSVDQESAFPEAIIVIGVSYPHRRGVITDQFSQYAKRMTKRLNRKYPLIRITVFNFYTGIKETKYYKAGVCLNKENYRFLMGEGEEKILALKAMPDESTMYFPGVSEIGPERDVTKKEYLQAFHEGKMKEASPSIGDVYSYIESLGISKPKKLREVHYFSHAWEDGPILANTARVNEIDPITLLSVRINDGKYLDKDGRCQDFDPLLTVIKKLSDFRAAFSDDAFSAIWGCQAIRAPKAIINQTTRRQKIYKWMMENPTEPILEFEYSKSWNLRDEEEFHVILNDDLSEESRKKPEWLKKSEPKSLNNIVDILAPYLVNCYAHRLANGTKKPVVAALPGTYGDYDHLRKYDLLMHIPMGSKFDDHYYDQEKQKEIYMDSRYILEFYKKHLKCEPATDKDYDPVYGRGYAVYKPSNDKD
jgi:hypothetical protein